MSAADVIRASGTIVARAEDSTSFVNAQRAEPTRAAEPSTTVIEYRAVAETST